MNYNRFEMKIKINFLSFSVIIVKNKRFTSGIIYIDYNNYQFVFMNLFLILVAGTHHTAVWNVNNSIGILNTEGFAEENKNNDVIVFQTILQMKIYFEEIFSIEYYNFELRFHLQFQYFNISFN